MRALLIVLAASLVLAGCGASHVRPTAASLAAQIRWDGGPVGLKASCTTRHTCTVTWPERVHDAHEGWLIAFGEVFGIDTDPNFHSIRHLNLRIEDQRTQRVTSFTCALKHRNVASADANTSPPRDWGCVETQSDLV